MKYTYVIVLYAVAFLLVVPLLAAPLTMVSSYFENTLTTHPDWGASKTRVTMDLMGANAYATEMQALAGNRLNLDAWHGYHEVMYRKAIVPQRLEFQFYLGENAYIYLIFNRERPYAYDTGVYHAIRLSTSPEKPCSLLQVAASGEFLERSPLDAKGTVRANGWNKCVVTWKAASGAMEITVNEQPLATFVGNYGDTQYIGFRGGRNPARVDTVRIREQDNTRHTSSFNPDISPDFCCACESHAISATLLARRLRRVPTRCQPAACAKWLI